MESIIEIQGISKTFGNENVLKEVTFNVYKGEILVILGASGAGKTTLLKILAGLEQWDEGSLNYTRSIYDGVDVPLPVVFQDFDQLLPWYTVVQNMLLPYERKNLSQRDVEIVEFLGLQGHLKKYPHELSGGMKQRVAIGRSLLSDSKIIFMDEPFGSLDVQRRRQLQDLILDINKRFGRAIVFITHDIQEARYLAHRMGKIEEGVFSILDDEAIGNL